MVTNRWGEEEREAPAHPLVKSRQKAVPVSGKRIDDFANGGDELAWRLASESNLFSRHCQTFLAAVPTAAIFASVRQLHLHRCRKKKREIPFTQRSRKGGMFLINTPYRQNLHNIRGGVFRFGATAQSFRIRKKAAVCSYEKRKKKTDTAAEPRANLPKCNWRQFVLGRVVLLRVSNVFYIIHHRKI